MYPEYQSLQSPLQEALLTSTHDQPSLWGKPDRPDWSWPPEMDEKWWEWAYGYGSKLVDPQTDGLIMFNPPTIGGVMRHRASIRIGTK